MRRPESPWLLGVIASACLTMHAGDPDTRKAEARASRAQDQAGSIEDAGRT